MFADDLLLHKTIHSVQDYLDLQADINALAKWLVDHKLSLNVKKCKSLSILEKRVVLFPAFHQSPLITVHSIRFRVIATWVY